MSDNPTSPEAGAPPSKTARKRAAEALQKLGESLIRLSDDELVRLPIPDRLREAVIVARGMSRRGALKRQRQYIGRLMREVETEPLQQALERLQGVHRAATARLHQIEYWRERLIADGDPALEELLQLRPAANRDQLRKLLRRLHTETAAERLAGHKRALFRELHRLFAPNTFPRGE